MFIKLIVFCAAIIMLQNPGQNENLLPLMARRLRLMTLVPNQQQGLTTQFHEATFLL